MKNDSFVRSASFNNLRFPELNKKAWQLIFSGFIQVCSLAYQLMAICVYPCVLKNFVYYFHCWYFDRFPTTLIQMPVSPRREIHQTDVCILTFQMHNESDKCLLRLRFIVLLCSCVCMCLHNYTRICLLLSSSFHLAHHTILWYVAIHWDLLWELQIPFMSALWVIH